MNINYILFLENYRGFPPSFYIYNLATNSRVLNKVTDVVLVQRKYVYAFYNNNNNIIIIMTLINKETYLKKEYKSAIRFSAIEHISNLNRTKKIQKIHMIMIDSNSQYVF